MGGVQAPAQPGRAVFPLADSIRAVAALAVLLGHTVVTQSAAQRGGFVAGDVARVADDSVIAPHLASLRVGVVIFFVLSGFLLYRPFVQAHADGRAIPSLRAYAARRILRIVPAYWVALAAAIVLIGAASLSDPGQLARLFGFLQIYSWQTYSSGLGIAWSLCIEMAFYAFVPAFAVFARRLAMRRVARGWLSTEATLVAALIAASVLYKLVLLATWRSGVVPPLPIRWLPGCLDQFAVGMGLAVLSVHVARTGLPRALRVVDRFPALPWALAAVAFLTLGQVDAAASRASISRQTLIVHALQSVVALGVVLPAVVGDPRRGIVRRLLAHRALLFVGGVSYGVYLWHLTITRLLADLGIAERVAVPGVVFWPLVVTALSVLAATVSYYAVERPALRLKARFGGGPGPDPLGAGGYLRAEGPLTPVAAPAGASQG